MIIQIEADEIADVLDTDECLAPAIEDLLLDALIEYRDGPQRIYEPRQQITKHADLKVRITIASDSPRFFRDGDGITPTPTDV